MIITVSQAWQRNFNRSDHLDHITQAHGVGKPTHRLLGVAASFGITRLIIVRFSQQRQPAEAPGLNNREIQLGGLRVSDALALLLNQ